MTRAHVFLGNTTKAKQKGKKIAEPKERRERRNGKWLRRARNPRAETNRRNMVV